MEHILEVRNLTKEFYSDYWHKCDPVIAVDNVSFKIKSGELVCIFGQNGSGKTTLIKMLSGIILPTKGKIYINNYELNEFNNAVKRYIGLISDDTRNFFWRLSGRENLRFFASLYDLFFKDADKRIEELVNLLKMDGYIERKFYTYSTGMRQKLAIARALLHNPPIVLMDESTKGLDVDSALYLINIIKDKLVLENKKIVIFSTSDYEELVKLNTKTMLLRQGRILAYDLFENIKYKINEDTL